MDKLKMFPRCHCDSKHSRQCIHFIINQAKIPYDIKSSPPLNPPSNKSDPYTLFWKHEAFNWIRTNVPLFMRFKKIITHSLKLLHTKSRVLQKDLKQIVRFDDKLTPHDVTNKLINYFKYPNARWVPHMLSV